MARPATLIVGGAGYFGARLAEALAPSQDVTVTYRSMSPVRQVWLDAAPVSAFAYDSARDTGLATDRSFDLVVNLAMPGAREAQADPEAAMDRALATAGACAALLTEGRAKRLVHFSTFHVYGGAGAPDYPEDTLPTPSHPYGATHLAVERALAGSAAAEQIAMVRPTNLVGAPAHRELGDQAGLIFLDLCRQAAETGRMVLRNDGLSYRDVLAFPDAVDAVRLLAEVPALPYSIFNLAAGTAVTLQSIAEGIAEGLHDPVEIAYGDGTDPYRSEFHVDISRLTALGWTPTHDFRAEAARAVAAFRR